MWNIITHYVIIMFIHKGQFDFGDVQYMHI